MSFQFKLETETGITEVTQGAALVSVEDKLNYLGTKYLSGNLPVTGVIYDFNLDGETGVTIVPPPENDEPFTLNAPVAGSIRDPHSVITVARAVVDPTRTGAIAINRILIGYSAANRFANLIGDTESERKFVYFMVGLINNATLKFMQELGPTYVQGCTITAERPGEPNKYFRECDNMAAFEFRLILYKE